MLLLNKKQADMKLKTILPVMMIALLSAIAIAFTTVDEGKSKASDTENSEILWKGHKVTGEHAGTLEFKETDLKFEGTKLIGGSFVVDMTTLKVTDLEGNMAKKLAGHLKSADFFGTGDYPTSKFNITKVEAGEKDNEYAVTGDLTIKKTTLSINFPVKVVVKNKTFTSTATLKVDRSKFDIRYGSGSFFDGLGDKMIYDEFDLDIKIVTTRTGEPK